MSEQAEAAGDVEEAAPQPRAILVQGIRVDDYPELAPEAARGSSRRIIVIGERILHRPCREVTAFGTEQLGGLIDDMFHTMYVAEGVGLAANQVGVDLRVFVYDCPDEDGVRHVGHLCNPVLDEPASVTVVAAGEGCLSVPGPHAELGRPDHAVVRGPDADGRPTVIEGTGYFARCLQHETDHLNGRLYVDLLTPEQRAEVLQQMAQQRDEVFAEREANAAALADREKGTVTRS